MPNVLRVDYYSGEPKKKMQLSVSLPGEDQTIGNVLRESLMKDNKRVQLATYNPDPSKLTLYAKSRHPPKPLLLEHIDRLERQVQHLEKDLLRQLEAWSRG